MEITAKHIKPSTQRSNCIIVGVFEKRRLSPAAKAVDDATGELYIGDTLNHRVRRVVP